MLDRGKDQLPLGLGEVPVVAGVDAVVVLELPDTAAALIPDLPVGELEAGEVVERLSLRGIPPGILALQIVFPGTVRDVAVEPVLALATQVIAVAMFTDPLGKAVAVVDVDSLIVLEPIAPRWSLRKLTAG